MVDVLDKSDKKVWYETVGLEDAKSFIKANLSAAARSFIAIGYYLKHIRDQELFREDHYETVWEFAKGEFGISKSTASRYMSMNDRFSKDGNSPLIQDQYKEFGKSQLQEMLSLTDEQIETVTPDITVQKLREMRSSKEIPYFEIEGQMDLEEDFPETMPDMPQEDQIPLKQSFTMDIMDLLDEEPEEKTVAISQQEESELVPELNVDESSCPPYDNHSCRRQEWGDSQEEQEKGRRECAKCWAEWKELQKVLNAAEVQQSEENAAKMQQEELSPIERGCITGLSPYGNCVCCGADGVKCCGQCDENCNGRCGWLDKLETEPPAPKMEYELRGKYCDAAARKLIESKHEWFAADHMNRVLQVNESEKQLKEQLAGKEAWYFADPCGNGIAHMNLFQDYIQFFDGDSWVGECEWFYLCAAIQGMWNVIAIENIQAELHEKENKPELCKEESHPEPETDQLNNVVDAEFTEIKPDPARYDKDIMKEMIHQEEQMLSEMGEDWKKRKPYYYTKHTMMLEAYRMLQMARENIY